MALVAGGASADVGGRWKMRPLLVFAPDAAAAERQTGLIDAASREDLKLAVYVVTPGAIEPLSGAPEPKADETALRARFDVDPADFRVVLIGLDGGAKLVADAPISLERLTTTIDAMPMRRGELRNRN